jgi:hypothetical protein
VITNLYIKRRPVEGGLRPKWRKVLRYLPQRSGLLVKPAPPKCASEMLAQANATSEGAKMPPDTRQECASETLAHRVNPSQCPRSGSGFGKARQAVSEKRPKHIRSSQMIRALFADRLARTEEAGLQDSAARCDSSQPSGNNARHPGNISQSDYLFPTLGWELERRTKTGREGAARSWFECIFCRS